MRTDGRWWTSDDMMATEHQVQDALWGLVRAIQPACVVETGAYEGKTSRRMGEALRDNEHGVLHAIEPKPELAAKARRVCEGLPVEVHEASSLDFTPPGKIDFAFLDSMYAVRRGEFEHFLPHFSGKAVIAFHDTGNKGDFAKYVRGLREDGRVNAVFIPSFRGLTLATVVA